MMNEFFCDWEGHTLSRDLEVEMLGRVSKAGGTSCSDVIVQMMTYYLLPIIVLSMIAYLMVLFVLFIILD